MAQGSNNTFEGEPLECFYYFSYNLLKKKFKMSLKTYQISKISAATLFSVKNVHMYFCWISHWWLVKTIFV